MNQPLQKQSQSAARQRQTVRARTAHDRLAREPGARSCNLTGAGSKQQADQSTLASPYQKLVMMVFTPVMPNPTTKLTLLRRLLKKYRYCGPLSKRLTEIYRDRNYARTAEELARDELLPEKLDRDEVVGLDWLIVATGGLDGSASQGAQAIQFARNLLETMREYRDYPSAVRVQAGTISAGGHVIFAGQDVNIVAEHYHGNKSALKAYLAAVRTEWDIPTTTIHPASQHHTSAALHQLYTPVDIWTDQRQFHNVGVEELNARVTRPSKRTWVMCASPCLK